MERLTNIYGKLTDFEGNSIANGDVDIYNDKFSHFVYRSKTDESGNYNLEVKSGIYMAIAAVKDHGIKYLEYWGWNLPAFEDMEINMRINGLEVYAINAFMIQRSRPNNSLMIYFRPMSLKRVQKFREGIGTGNDTILDVTPTLDKNDIDVTVDGQQVEIIGMNRVMEEVVESHQKVMGYLIQVSISGIEFKQQYSKIHIALKDKETGEKGEGSLFWQKPEAFNSYIKQDKDMRRV